MFDNVKNTLIKDDRIDMNSELGDAIGVYGSGHSIRAITISDNVISGRAASAFYIASPTFFGFPPSDIGNISFSDNNIENYETTCSNIDELGAPSGCVDVFFGGTTHDLTFSGEAGIVIDRGVNNTFTEN